MPAQFLENIACDHCTILIVKSEMRSRNIVELCKNYHLFFGDDDSFNRFFISANEEIKALKFKLKRDILRYTRKIARR